MVRNENFKDQYLRNHSSVAGSFQPSHKPANTKGASSFQETPVPDSSRWILRMAQGVGQKIPYNIQMKDGRPFVFAGLWEGWKRPGSENWIRTCTIITGEPNELIREIHTRMPVILPEDQLDAWLSGEAGKEILVPYPADEMMVWPISRV